VRGVKGDGLYDHRVVFLFSFQAERDELEEGIWKKELLGVLHKSIISQLSNYIMSE
jgi:hypothetical protein